MDWNPLLPQKITFPDYAQTIARLATAMSAPEQALLADILHRFDFDPVQSQALVQAVIAQSRFDPNAQHWQADDDEDVSGICPHCLNPPVPPLRDYIQWREQQAAC